MSEDLYSKMIEELISSLDPDDAKAKPSALGKPLLDLIKIEDGWNKFLKTLGRLTFKSDFSFFHADFWKWYWRLTMMRYMGYSLSQEQLSYLAMWGRGNGKSSNIEWAAIVEGCVGLPGYVLYVCGTQSSANDHVLSIRNRIESDDIAQYFPHMSDPLLGAHGNKYGWRSEFLMTKGGWAIRPVGLDVAVRGLKAGDLRPTMIIFDDIDSHKDGLEVISKKVLTIAREILPAGTENTIELFGQNVIHENSVINMIRTGKTDIMANSRKSFVPTFKDMKQDDIETTIDLETGLPRHRIIKAIPNWKNFDMISAQRYLDKSGLFAFWAEYQHDFTLDSSDKVLPEYMDYPTHVITWSQFEEKYKTRYTVPKHWQRGVGVDLGYSSSHIAAWSWIGVGSQDSGLPNMHFCYRGMTFVAQNILDQAEVVLERLKIKSPTGGLYNEFSEGYSLQRMSHEKLGERLLLNRHYRFNFSPAMSGKEDGIPEWREKLRVDYTQPHPFHADKRITAKKKDGTEYERYEIGRPSFVFVVEDSQLSFAMMKDDFGFKVHRAQALGWKRRKVTMSVTGLSKESPAKVEDDTNDSIRQILAERLLTSSSFTIEQIAESQVSKGLRFEDIKDMIGNEDYNGIILHRQMEITNAKATEQAKRDLVLDIMTKSLGVDPSYKKQQQRLRFKSLGRLP